MTASQLGISRAVWGAALRGRGRGLRDGRRIAGPAQPGRRRPLGDPRWPDERCCVGERCSHSCTGDQTTSARTIRPTPNVGAPRQAASEGRQLAAGTARWSRPPQARLAGTTRRVRQGAPAPEPRDDYQGGPRPGTRGGAQGGPRCGTRARGSCGNAVSAGWACRRGRSDFSDRVWAAQWPVSGSRLRRWPALCRLL